MIDTATTTDIFPTAITTYRTWADINISMSRVEELPDNYGEPGAEVERVAQNTKNLKISSQEEKFAPAEAHSSNAKDENGATNTTPGLPPEMRAQQSISSDEVLKKFNETPLFMTDIDAAMENGMHASVPVRL